MTPDPPADRDESSAGFDAVAHYGPVLAEGRDARIHDLGAGRVVRRAKDGRSIAREAQVMRYVAGQGFPVPNVYDVLEDGRAIVMDRLEGPTLVQVAERRPWRIRKIGRMLGDLHVGLHRIDAPPWLDRVGDGSSIVHFDLHPLNVMLTRSGPKVIDWSNAVAGPGALDVADTWLVMAAADAEISGPMAYAVSTARRVMLASFLAVAGRAAAVRWLPDALARRTADPNISDAERRRMVDLIESLDGSR